MGYKKVLSLPICLVLFLFFSFVFLPGCKMPNFAENSAETAPEFMHVEIHFTGGSEPLVTYIKNLEVSQDGLFYQGGSATIWFYDQAGNPQGVFNHARVEYIKLIAPPPLETPQ